MRSVIALVAAEGVAVLDAARRREPVDAERGRRFARACVEMTEIGRLALAVLDGGVLASARLVELAIRVGEMAERSAVATDGGDKEMGAQRR